MKRQRGRGRKPGGGGGNPGNRPLESNGPDVKIRGTAAQIYEKYIQYSRDAQSSGDRVKYENYLQHAEHYFRIMAATMPRERLQQIQDGTPLGQQQEDRAEQEATAQQPANGQDVADDEDELDVAEASDAAEDSDDGEGEGEAPQPQRTDAAGNGEREGGRSRRRRGRRRPSDERNGDGERDGAAPPRNGGDPEARSALDALARKQGALSS